MYRARIAFLVTAIAGLASLTTACGGVASSPFFGAPGGEDGGSVEDAGVLPDGAPAPIDAGGPDSQAPWSPVCPSALPAIGTSCIGENLECEYGTASWSVSCDVVMQCQNGQWSSYQPSFEPCSAPPGPNSTACAASYASVPQGNSCTPTGLSCLYAQGLCSCQVPLGPEGPSNGTGYWECLPGVGCPFPRPRLGSACASEGLDCTYEACSYDQVCDGGVWQGEQAACALPGGAE